MGANILNPGLNLILRPMTYPELYDRYLSAIKNSWFVEEIDLTQDIKDLEKMTPAEKHLINRLVAFFAASDCIVAHNIVLSLYMHVNSPEARMYYGRQLYEEQLHTQFYLTLVDTYMPNTEDRNMAFRAIEEIPSIKRKAEFCFKWIDSIHDITSLTTQEDRRQFLLNLIGFAACVEGLFFFSAFASVIYLRTRGLLFGLDTGNSWVLLDETGHCQMAFDVINIIRREEPELFDGLDDPIREMISEAVECEIQFSDEALGGGILGLSQTDMAQYIKYLADRRLNALQLPPLYNARNPFPFMVTQDLMQLDNFFERRPVDYQASTSGRVAFDEEF